MAPLPSHWWRDDAALQKFTEEWSAKLRDIEEQEIEEFLRAKEHHDAHDGHFELEPKLEETKDSKLSTEGAVSASHVETNGTEQAETKVEVPQPSAGIQEPPAEAQQPPAEAQQPAAEVPQPPAEAQQPPAEVPQPPAEAQPRPAEAQQPAEVLPQQPAEARQPPAEVPVPQPSADVEVPPMKSDPLAAPKVEDTSTAEKASKSADPTPVSSQTAEPAVPSSTGGAGTTEAAPRKEETEKQEKAPMDPEAVRAAAQKASDVLSQLLQKPLEYEVREALPCYSDPDTNSKEIRNFSVGQVLQGYPGGGWLKLQPSGKGWAHIGRSLALTCLVPTIRARYLEAIDLTWPGFSGLLKPGVKVIYIVEWRCRKSGAAGHTVCQKTHEVVSNMPPGKALEIHVAVRLRGALAPGVDAAPEVRFAGPWVEAQTLNPKDGEDDEDAEACLDPFGTARAGCLDCNCYGFFWRPGLEEQADSEEQSERVGLNADPDTIKCIRCGDPFATHTRAGTPAAERLLDSRPARTFLVAHSRVFVRSKRSTTGDAIGAIKQGTEISGCTEGRWLHLSRESAQAVNAMPKNKSDTRYVDAWVLMDGSHIGIASDLLVPEELAPPELRERAQQEEEARQKRREEVKKSQEKKVVTRKGKDAAKEVKEPDSEDEADAVKLKEPLQSLMEVLYTKAVDYLILKPQLPIHRRPSTSSRTLGQLKRGQIVSGWPQESWLLLADKGTTPKSTKGGWILVDASCLGLGQQAQAQCPVPKELRPFSEAVVVEWTKFPARHVEYQVEWAEESEKDKITVARSRETMTMARVHELPADSQLIFRLTAKVYTAPPEQGGEIFTEAVGPWEEAETGATIEKLEEGNLCVDPLANLRGRCMDCSCHGFVLAEYGERPRTGDTLEEVSCRRCREFHYRNPSAASVKRPPVSEAPKALPAPKEEVRPITWKVEDGEGHIQFVLDKVGEAHTLYETLGVTGDADKAMIRSAYRQVSLSIHPDKVGHLEDLDLQKQAENAFKVVSSAYEILNDDKKRAEYDRKLRLTGATFGSRSGGRFNLTNIAFLKKFLSKEKGGFGWDLSAKPPGDWEEQAPGVYVRGSGKPKEAEEPSET
eukprot:s1628_g11.t1